MGLMLLLCMIWGLQQVVLKAAAPDIAPILLIALRSGIAAVLVGLLMFVRGERISLAAGTWRPGLLVGVLFALEFLFVGEGLRHTSASHTVVFLSRIFLSEFPGRRIRLTTSVCHATTSASARRPQEIIPPGGIMCGTNGDRVAVREFCTMCLAVSCCISISISQT